MGKKLYVQFTITFNWYIFVLKYYHQVLEFNDFNDMCQTGSLFNRHLIWKFSKKIPNINPFNSAFTYLLFIENPGPEDWKILEYPDISLFLTIHKYTAPEEVVNFTKICAKPNTELTFLKSTLSAREFFFYHC